MNLNNTGTSIPTKPTSFIPSPPSNLFDSQETAQHQARKLASSHYENFTVALPGLSRDRFQDLCNIYYFCRVADDYADELDDPRASREKLAELRQGINRLFDRGDAVHPATQVLRPTLERRKLTRRPFLDLISAFQQDLTVDEYETFQDLLDYCERSANPVGRLVLQVFEREEPLTRHYSDSTCTALQLTNFWADVDLDLDRGRVYIPREDLNRFSVSRENLRDRTMSRSLRALLAFEVERTRDWFRCGWSLTREVGGTLGLMVELYNAGGWAVLDRLEEQNYDVFTRRWTLSGMDKTWLVVRGLWRFAGGISNPPG